MPEVKKIGILLKYSEATPIEVLPGHIRMIEETVPGVEVITAESEKDMIEYGVDCDVILSSRHIPLSMKYYEKAFNLKWIQCLMSGIDGLLIPEIQGKIRLTSTRGIHGPSIAEHTMAMILSLARGLHLARDYQRRKIWKKPLIPEQISGKTAGIIGLGHIGKAIVRQCSAAGMRVIAASRTEPAQKGFLDNFFSLAELNMMLAETDYLVLIVPYTRETHHLIDEEELRAMKESSFLINVARGKVVNETALIKALKENWITGAGLDVQYEEPLPEDNELWSLDNVIITPHMAGLYEGYMDRAIELFCFNLKRYGAGLPLQYEHHR